MERVPWSEGWHRRVPTAEDRQRFKNIASIHAVTRSWLNEITPERQTHALSRIEAPGIQENLWLLEGLSDTHSPAALDTLLDDSSPNELLDRMERTAWIVQAWTLSSLFEKTPAGEKPALMNILAQSSWKCGRECAQQRWSRFPVKDRGDLRALLTAFLDSPICQTPSKKSLLVQRVTRESCQVDLLSCPHTSQYPEVKSLCDSLCELQSHWMRGFLYALNTQVHVDYQPGEKQTRCSHHWTLKPRQN